MFLDISTSFLFASCFLLRIFHAIMIFNEYTAFCLELIKLYFNLLKVNQMILKNWKMVLMVVLLLVSLCLRRSQAVLPFLSFLLLLLYTHMVYYLKHYHYQQRHRFRLYDNSINFMTSYNSCDYIVIDCISGWLYPGILDCLSMCCYYARPKWCITFKRKIFLCFIIFDWGCSRRGGEGSGRTKRLPLLKIRHTYTAMMKLGSYTLPKEDSKNVWIKWHTIWVLLTSAFLLQISKFCYVNKYRYI